MKRLGPVAVLILSLLLPLSTAADTGIDGATNAFRTEQGLPPLLTDAVLTDLAAKRAFQIAQPGGWEHNFWWWDASGCYAIAENIAYRIPAPEDSASYAVGRWIDSPAHRANILGDWDLTGSAIYFAPDGGMYAAQLFGSGCSRGSTVPEPAPDPKPQPEPAPAPQPSNPTPSTEHIPASSPPSVQSPLVPMLPDTAMRSPCQTSRTLRPSLNRMTGTSSLY